MSCHSPHLVLVPLKGGSPIFVPNDVTVRGVVDYPKVGRCRVTYLPCGHCIACRRERRQDLTVLQSLEASLYDENWFLTLTYDDAKFSSGVAPRSLDKQHLKDFVISMRKYCAYNGASFRFFACGEYGDEFERPHYHMSIFGLSSSLLGIADDDEVIQTRKRGLYDNGRIVRCENSRVDSNGNFFWQSPVISDRWRYGNHQIYRANRETFQYVAGYTVKKLSGDRAKAWLDSGRVLPYFAQSRPSIGFPWFERFGRTLAQTNGEKLVNDSVSVGDITWRIPRIMMKWFERFDPVHFDEIKYMRGLNLKELDPNEVKRKKDFDEYSARHFKQHNKHKEIK